MSSKRISQGALLVAAIATIALVTNVFEVNAQTTSNKPATAPSHGKAQLPAAKEVTLTGRLVDLHCFMTGEMLSADVAKCTADCIRAGVPAGLETKDGVVVLGQGVNGPAKLLLPFAYQNIEVRGKLFEKNKIRYLDIVAVNKAHDTGGK